METNDPNKKVDLNPDKILNEISLSRQKQEFAILQGILGENDESSLRIYLSYELDSYVVVPTESIVHRERIKDETGLELSILHIKKHVTLEVIAIYKEQIESEYLEEAIKITSSNQYASAETGIAWTATIPIATRLICTHTPKTPRITVVCTVACTIGRSKVYCVTKSWPC